MSSKIAALICFMFISFFSNAQEATPVGKTMIDNLRVDNSRRITIPSQTDVLRIYIEKKNINPMNNERVEINHHEKKSTFHTGANFAVTQDEILVFARKDEKVYAKAFQNKDEALTIQFKNLKYIFEKNMIKVHSNKIHEEFYAEEVIFDTADNSFIVYNKGKVVKKIAAKAV